MKIFNKKGQAAGVGQLAPFAIAFGIAVVIAAILTLVAGSIGDSLDDGDGNLTTKNLETNVSDNGLGGLENISAQFGTIGTVGGVLVLLIMVLAIFGFRRVGE